LGPVFESSQTVLSAISTLPKTVTHLDLDLRNALHLLPQALPLLFSKHHLKSLSVRVFGDTGAIELSKWMYTNPNLEHLDLRGNRIGSLGARTIIDAIIAASSNQQHKLSHLNLSCNCILHGDLIGQLLASTTTIMQTLDLSFNWLGNQEVDDICMGLRNNTSLKELNLFGCHRINHDGMKTLLHCVQHYNTSIHTINLQTFDDEGKRLVNEINYWLKLNKAGRYLIKEEDSFLPSSSSLSLSLSSSENEHQQQEQGQRSCYSSINSNRNRGVPSGLWSLALAKTNQDPDSIFYLVREGLSPRVFQQQRHR
jgi:Ran GTPase-activating protein (RanGAP) involved in mRNA processing and transport